MKHLGLQMRVASQHLPILMPCNEGYLFDCKSSFEQAARAFMAQIMKMKIVDIQVNAPSTEGGTD